MMDVRAKIEAGYYTSKLPYPTKPRKPVMPSRDAGSKAMRAFADELDVYETLMVTYRVAMVDYNLDDRQLGAEFKVDMLAELGLTGHPKAEVLFNKAWDAGHGSGLAEVLTIAEDLVELVL